MLRPVAQRFQVESGRLLRVVDLQDPDTGAADQQVEVVGEAPPGSQEGDSAENPEDLVKSSPDYYPGTSGDTYGYGNIGNQLAQSMQSIYGSGGGGSPADQAGYGGNINMGVKNNAYLQAQENGAFQNTGLPPTGATAQNPTGGQPGAGTQPGQPLATNPLTGGANTADIMRGQTLFNTDDPTTAVNSALRSMGVNPFNTGNPFVQFMQRAAPGLAAAFIMQNAVGGQTAQSVADAPYAFKDFLTGSIKGGHALGGLASAAGLLPQIIDKIRAESGGNALEVNPFLSQIANILGTGFGEGTTGILQALLSPTMNRGLAAGYRSGLEKALSSAQYNFPFEQVSEGQANGPDIWKFLLGH